MSELLCKSSRIGVLTFHRCINYGCYWQARCLSEALRARGFAVELLDHHAARVNIAEWRCAYRPQLPAPPDAADYPKYRRKIEAFFAAFEQLALSAPFALDRPGEMPAYDCLVVGSDEVWNLGHPWYGGAPLFWGEEARARRLISYAASFGSQTNHLDEFWAAKLRRFDAISVRDANSQHLVAGALGFLPPLVLDPCLQWPVAPQSQWRGSQTPFIAVYGHDFSPAFVAQARRYAKNCGLPLVSIGYSNAWAHEQWLDAGPHDFAGFMARATAVVTNFFHGCVFALANGKPLACETSDYRWIKVSNLMQTVGAPHRLVGPQCAPADFDALLDQPSQAEVAGRLAELRAASERYLDEALG